MMAFNDDSRDRAAMDAFFRKYGRYLYTYALRRLNDRNAAEDVVLESFRRVLERYDALRGLTEEVLLRYLLRMITNGCVDCYRAGGREYANEELVRLRRQSETADSPQRQVELEFERKLIEHCVTLLPENYRTILELRVLQGMEYADIAVVMQVSEANARMLMTRARRKLLALYRQNEEEWSDREQKHEV